MWDREYNWFAFSLGIKSQSFVITWRNLFRLFLPCAQLSSPVSGNPYTYDPLDQLRLWKAAEALLRNTAFMLAPYNCFGSQPVAPKLPANRGPRDALAMSRGSGQAFLEFRTRGETLIYTGSLPYSLYMGFFAAGITRSTLRRWMCQSQGPGVRDRSQEPRGRRSRPRRQRRSL